MKIISLFVLIFLLSQTTVWEATAHAQVSQEATAPLPTLPGLDDTIPMPPGVIGPISTLPRIIDPTPKSPRLMDPASKSMGHLQPTPEDEESQKSLEESLSQWEGVEFQHEKRNYIRQNGRPFEKRPDGTLKPVPVPEQLFVIDNQGQKWLSPKANDTVYINLTPKVWAIINFVHDSATIEESSEAVLDAFGTSLNSPALANQHLIISGHTDSSGRDSYNLKLSRKRAQSVGNYLIKKHNFNPDRLILHGHGEKKPLGNDDTEEGKTLNRRVEFILLEPS